MTEHVKREISDGVMTLTLQRPEKKNAAERCRHCRMQFDKPT